MNIWQHLDTLGVAEMQEHFEQTNLAVRGSDIRMDSILPPVRSPNVVPRSYTRLNSTYLRMACDVIAMHKPHHRGGCLTRWWRYNLRNGCI